MVITHSFLPTIPNLKTRISSSPRKPRNPRRPFLKREISSIIKLRRIGYTIPVLSRKFDRSPSVIHRILKRALKNGVLRFWRDLRKIPRTCRERACSLMEKRLDFMFPGWKKFILGEEEKPP